VRRELTNDEIRIHENGFFVNSDFVIRHSSGVLYAAAMQLILIRHGKAEERDDPGNSGKEDALRSLTPEGKRQMKGAAKGLGKLIEKIDLLATSPLKRAVQTAELVYSAYGDEPQFVELELLSGGHSAAAIVKWIKEHDLDMSTVCLVGHEPDLSRWIGFFVTGKEKSVVAMKKGMACVLEFGGAPGAGKGIISAVYSARALRHMT
jgi:phosphohistidine phosphatase